jgi:hypothetical protein
VEYQELETIAMSARHLVDSGKHCLNLLLLVLDF